ncbi:heavy metal sensor kinase [Silvibacterium bohemicum]|uniref:histidine kinase n=1 Tax=Silvibacterium bohemicum TaxID=1577686 RepID=A0A841JUP4_9BACT|nr:ATP-binding protein [Silvibacterium bohemicum]MBB6142711.1 heavy metal sensor kinase [Silvibacterium bohemicum]
MRDLSVRAKLTLLYLAVTSAGLLAFGILSYGALRFALLQEKKTHLIGREQRLIQFLVENRIQSPPLPMSEQLRNYAIVTHEGNLFEIRNTDGSLLFPREVSGPDAIVPPSDNCVHAVFFLQSLEHRPAMVMCHLTQLNGRPVRLLIGGSLEEEFDILLIYRNALLLLAPALLSAAAICGYLLSRQSLKTVDRMTKAAINIGVGNLSTRLPVPSARDEIQELAVAWNQLLDRVQSAVSRLSKFSEDVSHDLRTSITVILGTAQLSLHRDHSEEEYREDLSRVVDECRTASTLLDALLSLARSDTFSYEAAFQPINLCDLVVNGCRRVEDLAESRGIMLDWRLPLEPVYIQGDELLLLRLLGILLDNAIKYTREGGEITAAVSRTEDQVLLTVSDTGIGMSEDVRQRVFERYYQGELRERQTQPGNGLGLAIARWIADAHQAELTAESTPATGSVFQISLPSIVSRPLEGQREQYAAG